MKNRICLLTAIVLALSVLIAAQPTEQERLLPLSDSKTKSEVNITRDVPGDDIYDLFYDDDTTATLNFFLNDNASQIHNFYSPGDVDWALFNVDIDRWYSVNVTDQAEDCDAIIYMFHESNIENLVRWRDDSGPGGADELISWYSGPTSGTMLVQITQSPFSPDLSGELTTYTLTITGDWGGNAGLATIGGNRNIVTIGPDGGTAGVSDGSTKRKLHEKEEKGIFLLYTKHQVFFPSGALDTTHEFMIGSSADIGNEPWFSYTENWLASHPTNASIVYIFTASGTQVDLLKPVELTVQFVDAQTNVDDVFVVDDRPAGTRITDMRIHEWTGYSWQVVNGDQTVNTDTVTVWIESLGEGIFAVAPVEPLLGSENWTFYY